MNTVGQILKDARLAKGYTLDQVEAAIKVRSKFLEAIEADDFSKLPSLSYAKGFVKNYSDFLGLNSNNVLAFFRRQSQETARPTIAPRGLANPLNQSWLRLTPGRFLTIIVIILVSIFLLYFGLQYRRLQEAPNLTIEKPAEKLVTTDSRIDLIGKTDPDATITVSGTSVLVKSDGTFFEQLALNPGSNKITIVATSRFGKSVTKTVEVGLQSQ